MSRAVTVALLVLALAAGCGGDGDGDGDGPGDGGRPPELTGSVCEMPSDCYEDLDAGALSGEARCLTRVRAGYCTHLCDTDDDCCAVEGECQTEFEQVCAPFESTGERMCFLSCEREDRPADVEEQEFCQQEASYDFVCRSTGGGADNRKVCVPGNCGVGARCGSDDHCDPDLECLAGFDGGYCSVRDCEGDADCPEGSACVVRDGSFDYCARICESESDCSFCRGEELAATCTDDVELADATGVTVCVP